MIVKHGIFSSSKRESAPPVVAGSLIYLDSRNTTSYSGTGTTWFDLSGNGNDSTLVNGVTFSTDKMVFDGTNDYVQTPLQYDLGVGGVNDFTFTCAIKTNDPFTTGGNLVSNYQGTPIPFNIVILPSGLVRLQVRNNSGTTFILSTTSVVNDNIFNTVTFSKTGSLYKAYVNGVLEASTTQSIGTTTTTNNIAFGTLNNLFNQQWYKDDYYTFLMYGSGLTDTQVLNNHNAII